MKRCLGCMQTYDKQLNMCPHCGYVENTSPEEAIHMVPGTILQDRFIIGKVVGCGGFGVTYIAWDKVLEHKVAIKEYLPSEFSTRMPGVSHLTIFEGDKTEQFDDGMKKFLDEARRLAKFQNEPGIVKIFDCFEENRTAYIVMEYLQGVTLTHYLEEHGKITEDEAVQMILPILNSLKSVHREGIIHRDIAPDNIMVTADGQVKLIDFGAARYAIAINSQDLTVIVKKGYSPIEQYQSRGNQGKYTDVYAIGAVLYQMLTGIMPPDSMERNAYFENSHKDILEPLHKLIKDISENRENAILNAMNVRIEDRSPDMDTLILELTSDEPVALISGKIKRTDILKWPLWLKITIPMAIMGVIALLVLFVTGVIGFEFKKPREIYIPDGMTRVPRIISMDEDTAKNTLLEKQLNYMVVGTKNDETIESGCVLTQNASVGSIVAINYSVEVVISAGIEQYEVPYMVGILKEDAVTALESSFTYEIVEEFDSVIEKGYVTKQSIDGGVEVDKGTLITLTISKGRNPEIEYEFEGDKIPNLVGLTLVEAMELCEKSGIKLIVTSYEYSTEYAEMCVLEQNTDEGAVIKADTIVEIVLSKGAQIFKVPSILYLTEEEAIAKLEERELKYKLLYEENETVAEGCVASQSIASGTVIDKDDVIEVIISTGPPKFEMVDVLGQQGNDAIVALHELGLVVNVEYEYDNNAQNGTVISQSEDVGTKVNKGYEITIVICSDEEVIIISNVIGKTFDNAKSELIKQGFIIEKNEIYSESVEKNIVIDQTPRSGSGQKNGAIVVLTVSLGKQVESDNAIEEPTPSDVTDETEKITENTTDKAPEKMTDQESDKTTEALTDTEIITDKGLEKETEKTTNNESEKEIERETQGNIQSPTEQETQKVTESETVTQEETTTEQIKKYTIPQGCTFYDYSSGVTLQSGDSLVGQAQSGDEFITNDYKYHCYGDYWDVVVLDITKSKYEELLSMIAYVPLCDMEETFNKCANMTIAPEIPDTVTDMSFTFYDCTSLIEAPQIPYGVECLFGTFQGCVSLVNAPVIPDSVVNMQATFSMCENLINVPEIPKKVTNLDGTFFGCKKITKAPVLPEGIFSLLETFWGCEKLVEAPIIPTSVVYLQHTFTYCTSLKYAPEIPTGVVSLQKTFKGCSSLIEVPVIPQTVTNLYETFSGCSSLITAPVIPSSVTTMNGTFANCSSLTTAPIIPVNVKNVSSTFKNCTSLTGNVIINSNAENGYTECFYGVYVNSQNITITGTSTKLDNIKATGWY